MPQFSVVRMSFPPKNLGRVFNNAFIQPFRLSIGKEKAPSYFEIEFVLDGYEFRFACGSK